MIYINAISHHFPETSYSNLQIIEDYYNYGGEERLDPDDIYNQCGIKKRYSSDKLDTAKDLGNSAAEKLFDEWNINRKDIEYIVFVSGAVDYKGPTTACIMQNDLGLTTSVGAIDVLHGCTGYIYGLSLIKALIDSGQISNALLITSDVPTKVIHPIDIELRSLFSDAAAATFISNKKDENLLSISIGDFVFGTDGKGEHALKVERSAMRDPADAKWLSQFEDVEGGLASGRLVMKSSQIFLFALKIVPSLIQKVLEKNKLDEDQIDFFVLHQANGKMLDFLRKRMKLPKEKFVINIENIGNTVAATIPIALYDTIKDDKLKENDNIVVAGFGIGYSWGATTLKVL